MFDAIALPQHYAGLRDWAGSSRPLTASTELLIRTGLAKPVAPWIQLDSMFRRPWINFEWLLEMADRYSDRERQLLRIAASLAGEFAIVLGDEITDLDDDALDLVFAAIAHSAGINSSAHTFDPGFSALSPGPPPEVVHPWPGTGR